MKKVLVRGPALSQSGYGEHTRFVLRALRLQEAELDIHILENGLHPSGAGEPATSVVGAAVANAIFDAVGVRIRTLPIRRRDIVEALRAS